MAQSDDHAGHAAIDDLLDAEEEARSCPVCFEPADWVAAGRCGHREVCVSCAIRMRFFQDDRRCCLCRAFCPTVLITKSHDDGGGEQEAAFAEPPRSSPSSSSSSTPARREVGSIKYFWYHGGMAAYFDDPEQYDAARKACFIKQPACPRPPAEDVADDQAAPDRRTLRLESLLLALPFILAIGVGLAFCVAAYKGVFSHPV